MSHMIESAGSNLVGLSDRMRELVAHSDRAGIAAPVGSEDRVNTADTGKPIRRAGGARAMVAVGRDSTTAMGALDQRAVAGRLARVADMRAGAAAVTAAAPATREEAMAGHRHHHAAGAARIAARRMTMVREAMAGAATRAMGRIHMLRIHMLRVGMAVAAAMVGMAIMVVMR